MIYAFAAHAGAIGAPWVTVKAGFRLGNFEILGPIGTGGMGQVFNARDLDLDRIVAIKVLRPQIARDALLLQRFRREVKTRRADSFSNSSRVTPSRTESSKAERARVKH